jgi:signal transduction histidine kinase
MTSGESDPRPEAPITMRTLQRERAKVSQHVAAAIAHELQAPVFGIASAVQLLRYRNTDDPIIERNLGRILRDTERLNVLIAALLEFGRPDPVRLAPGDPDEVWKTVIATHRGSLESRALLVDHAAVSPRTSCALDRDQLAQALGNLLVNAIEAAPEGSDLTIRSVLGGDGAWQTRLHNQGAPIPADVLSRLFQPLVTQKAGHVGIGLAVAHRILGEHAGTVTFERSDGDGTTVLLTLPHAPASLP